MARPKKLPDGTVRLEGSIPADYDVALAALVAVTGEAKSSHLRRAVAWYLAEYGLGSPDVITPVITNLTTQPKENTP